MVPQAGSDHPEPMSPAASAAYYPKFLTQELAYTSQQSMAGLPISGQSLALAGQKGLQGWHNHLLPCEGQDQIARMPSFTQEEGRGGEQLANHAHVVNQVRSLGRTTNQACGTAQVLPHLFPSPKQLAS